jgi:hypothetical protein
MLLRPVTFKTVVEVPAVRAMNCCAASETGVHERLTSVPAGWMRKFVAAFPTVLVARPAVFSAIHTVLEVPAAPTRSRQQDFTSPVMAAGRLTLAVTAVTARSVMIVSTGTVDTPGAKDVRSSLRLDGAVPPCQSSRALRPLRSVREIPEPNVPWASAGIGPGTSRLARAVVTIPSTMSARVATPSGLDRCVQLIPGHPPY